MITLPQQIIKCTFQLNCTFIALPASVTWSKKRDISWPTQTLSVDISRKTMFSRVWGSRCDCSDWVIATRRSKQSSNFPWFFRGKIVHVCTRITMRLIYSTDDRDTERDEKWQTYNFQNENWNTKISLKSALSSQPSLKAFREGWTTAENIARGIYSCTEYIGILQ